MLSSSKWALLTAAAVVTSVPFGACAPQDEKNEEELPEVVEAERDDATGATVLEEEMVLGPGDVGDMIIATGWVEGKPLENGFFLRTEHKRLVFVETDHKMNTGDAVRVIGTVAKSRAEAFNSWEMEALGEDLNPDLDLWRGIYLDGQEIQLAETSVGAPSDSKESGAKPQGKKY